MNRIFLLTALGIFAFGPARASHGTSETPVSTPSASPMPSVSPPLSPSGGPEASPSPLILPRNPLLAHLPSPGATISKKDGQALLAELIKAQHTELKALEHRHRLETQELRASQSHFLREWDKTEKEARHKFFAEHPKGAERRPYVKEFRKRGEELRKTQSLERTKKSEDYEAHLKALKKIQAENVKHFKKSIDEGKAPSLDLWPKSGG